MTRPEDDRRVASQVALHRPWKCSRRGATYCPLCHDCTCKSRYERNPACALHGDDSTHGTREEMVR